MGGFAPCGGDLNLDMFLCMMFSDRGAVGGRLSRGACFFILRHEKGLIIVLQDYFNHYLILLDRFIGHKIQRVINLQL